MFKAAGVEELYGQMNSNETEGLHLGVFSMVFFECRLGENTANLRESLWLRRAFMPQNESHAQSSVTRVNRSIDLARSRARSFASAQGAVAKDGTPLPGSFYFRARAARASSSETS